MHSLQFQKDNLSPDNWDSGANSDIASAKQAIVEGEAEFVEETWQKRYFSVEDQIDYYKQSLGGLNLDQLRIPTFLERELYFPYLEGRAFIAYLSGEGGWAAVDNAFRNPPASTEMILHPEKYLENDEPDALDKPILADSLSAGWREVRDDAMGEFSTDLILAARVDAPQASQAAAGWGGDRFVVWRNDSPLSLAVVWHTRWDTQADADEFASALRQYDGGRFGEAVTEPDAVCWTAVVAACQTESGTDVWWFYGPDGKTVQALMESNLPAGSVLTPAAFPASIHFLPFYLSIEDQPNPAFQIKKRLNDRRSSPGDKSPGF
jgi:hypothetical protein